MRARMEQLQRYQPLMAWYSHWSSCSPRSTSSAWALAARSSKRCMTSLATVVLPGGAAAEGAADRVLLAFEELGGERELFVGGAAVPGVDELAGGRQRGRVRAG